VRNRQGVNVVEPTLSEQIAATEEGRRLLQQEGAILEVTELICELMEKKRVSRSELARRLGKTKGYVTQLLDGETNMTLRTIADVFTALGTELHVSTKPLDYVEDVSWTFSGRMVALAFMPPACMEAMPTESNLISAV
jgi:transcriptional regulator with XRE-family HTH domain